MFMMEPLVSQLGFGVLFKQVFNPYLSVYKTKGIKNRCSLEASCRDACVPELMLVLAREV